MNEFQQKQQELKTHIFNSFKELEKGYPKNDEERAQTHFNLTKEDWDKLSKKKKKEYISKLPERGTGFKEL